MINSSDKKQCCIAPEGNWKDFVILNYSQYMIDKKQEEALKEETVKDQDAEENKEDEKAA